MKYYNDAILTQLTPTQTDKREEMKNSHDQTYIKLGRMATFANMPDTDTVTRKADIVAATNELMSCLHVSGNALKSTRAKIDIIRYL